MDNLFNDGRQQQSRNKNQVVVDNVNLGSKWKSSHQENKAQTTVHSVERQPVGKKAVPWKTKSNFKYDFSSAVKLGKKSPEPSKLIDIFDYNAQK